jgi:single-stranded DNA-binding protein
VSTSAVSSPPASPVFTTPRAPAGARWFRPARTKPREQDHERDQLCSHWQPGRRPRAAVHLGRPVATVRFAVNSRKRTVGSDWVDQPASSFTGSVWGPMAENLVESVKKGDRVLVQGVLVTRTYTPSEGPRAGENLSRLEVEVDEIGPSLRWGTAASPSRPGGPTRGRPRSGPSGSGSGLTPARTHRARPRRLRTTCPRCLYVATYG